MPSAPARAYNHLAFVIAVLMLLAACSDDRQIDTRLNKDVTLATAQNLTANGYIPYSKGGVAHLLLNSYLSHNIPAGDQNQTPVLASPDSPALDLRVFHNDTGWMLEIKQEQSVAQFPINPSLSTPIPVRIVIKEILVQFRFWNKNDDVLNVWIGTSPLFQLKGVNNRTYGSQMLVEAEKADQLYVFKRYTFGRPKMSLRDFDLAQLPTEFKSLTPQDIPAQ